MFRLRVPVTMENGACNGVRTMIEWGLHLSYREMGICPTCVPVWVIDIAVCVDRLSMADDFSTWSSKAFPERFSP